LIFDISWILRNQANLPSLFMTRLRAGLPSFVQPLLCFAHVEQDNLNLSSPIEALAYVRLFQNWRSSLHSDLLRWDEADDMLFNLDSL